MIKTNFVLTGRGGVDFGVQIEVATATELLAELGVLQLSLFQAETGQTPSATVTPDKQAAAIDSAKKGTAGKAKPAADTKPAETTPIEALKDAVNKEKADTPAPRVYETSGIPDKVSKAVAKNRDAVVALLEKFEAKKDGKLSAKFLAVEHFDEFEKGIDAILAPADDLG